VTLNLQKVLTGVGTGSTHEDHHDLINSFTGQRINEHAIRKAVALQATASGKLYQLCRHSRRFGSTDPDDADPPLTEGGADGSYGIFTIHYSPIITSVVY
jgi:hypothetical protein